MVVAEAAVGGNGCFWVHYLTRAAEAVGAVPAVVGAGAVLAVEVLVEAAVADSAVVLVEAAGLAAAAPAEAGSCCQSYSESVNSVSIRDTQTKTMVTTVVQDALKGLIKDLVATHGDNLSSVVLYGSAAAGDHNELRSDYNLLITLKRITPQDLREAQAPMREWQRLGNPLPVYFTTEELSDAGDVFPIEFHQMADARSVLYGPDPFANLTFSDVNLRHQTEYELRSKLIQLRRMYIPASVSVEKLCDLMSDSLSSFAALFRAVLLLFGEQPPVGKPDCVRYTVQRLKLDPAPFERVFELRNYERLPSSEQEANDLFASYMFQIEQVVEAVDELRSDKGES